MAETKRNRVYVDRTGASCGRLISGKILLLIVVTLLNSPATFAALDCPNIPYNQDQKYKAWFIEKDSGRTIKDGEILPLGTTVIWHGIAEAYGHCDVYVPDSGSNQCILGTRQEHVVIKIGRGFYDPTGWYQPFFETFGLNPDGSTGFFHVLDTTDTATSTGPRQVSIAYVGPYRFFSENAMPATACNMQPDHVRAPMFTLYGRKPKKRCRAGNEMGVFGNPCNALDGVKNQTELDLSVGSIAVQRNYSSDTAFFDVGHGLGWSSQLSKRIERGGLKVNIVEADGRSETFENSDGVWSGSADTKYKVTSDAGGFLLRSRSSSFDRFDDSGNLLSSTTRDGRTITYTYNSDGKLSRVQDNFGKGFGVTFLGNRIAGVITDQGTSAEYFYGNDGELSSVKYGDGSVRAYDYDSRRVQSYALSPLLAGITDELGIRYAAWAYDINGKVISSEHAPSRTEGAVDKYGFQYSGSDFGGTNAVFDPRGNTWQIEYSYQAGSRVLTQRANSLDSSLIQQTFDTYGNRTSITDAFGVRTCFAFDTIRQVETKRVEGVPTTETAGCLYVVRYSNPLPPGSRSVSTQWHPDWDLKIKVAEPGRLTTYVYNGQPDPFAGGAVSSCAPNGALLPDATPIAVLCRQVEQATTDSTGVLGFGAALQAGVPMRDQKWTYNQFGQVLTHDGPRTDVADITTYAYYGDTTIDHTLGDLWKVTNALGLTTTYTKYNKDGLLLEAVDPNGVVTTHTYDLRQRLKTTTVGGRTTSYQYDPVGQLLKVTQPDGSFVGYEYDEAHRQVASFDNSGNRIDYTLDTAGNRTAERVKDPSGALKRELSRVFDALGRVQQTTGRE